MKKTIAVILVLLMLFSLAACGNNDTASSQSDPTESASSEESEAEEEPKSVFIGTWVGLYTGSTLTFSDDNSFINGSSKGTWSEETSTAAAVQYTNSSGTPIEMVYDVVEEDGVTFLQNRASGKLNGNSVSFSIEYYYPEDKVLEIRQGIAKSVGDMVSSDIIDLTVNSAELAWYAQGAVYDSTTKKIINVDDACAPSDESGFYKANKGRTLLCLDFTVTNTDRSSLNTSDYVITFSVNQNGQNATVMGYDSNFPDGTPGLNLSFSPIATDGGDFYKNDTSNIIISAGATVRIKVVCIFSFDADLDAPFNLVVSLKTSGSNSDKFLYNIE